MTASYLTEQTKLSFASSNSSFIECIRNHLSFHYLSSSFYSNSECNGPDYYDCILLTPHITFSSSASFYSCIFLSLCADVNGGAIHFTCSGALSLSACLFSHCCTNVSLVSFNGGGAVCVESGSLVISSTAFIRCESESYSGGVLAERDATSSEVSHCEFIGCEGMSGAGIMTYYGLSSSVFSSFFIDCHASWCGGGLYHDSDQDFHSLTLSNLLFSENSAKYKNNSDSANTRGGGAFEDYRTGSYSSTYTFIFFTGNEATNSVGNDVSAIKHKHTLSPITACYTTNTFHSFWNTASEGYVNWLP